MKTNEKFHKNNNDEKIKLYSFLFMVFWLGCFSWFVLSKMNFIVSFSGIVFGVGCYLSIWKFKNVNERKKTMHCIMISILMIVLGSIVIQLVQYQDIFQYYPKFTWGQICKYSLRLLMNPFTLKMIVKNILLTAMISTTCIYLLIRNKHTYDFVYQQKSSLNGKEAS